MSNILPIASTDFIIERFSKKLKEQRRKKGYTQEQMASILKVSTKTYRSWEKTTLPKTEDLFNLANILECDVDYLLGRMSEESHLKEYINKYFSLSAETFEKLSILEFYQHSKSNNEHSKIATEWNMILEYLINTENGNYMLDQIRQYVTEEKVIIQNYSYFALLHGKERHGSISTKNWNIISSIVDSLSEMKNYFRQIKAQKSAAKFIPHKK